MTLTNGARIRVANYHLVLDQIDEEFSTAGFEITLAGSVDGAASAIRPVALLVCDIRGFSSMAEKISSSYLAQHLGGWFREAGNLVDKSAGTIDKFLGDAMLAYWNGTGKLVPARCRLRPGRL